MVLRKKINWHSIQQLYGVWTKTRVSAMSHGYLVYLKTPNEGAPKHHTWGYTWGWNRHRGIGIMGCNQQYDGDTTPWAVQRELTINREVCSIVPSFLTNPHHFTEIRTAKFTKCHCWVKGRVDFVVILLVDMDLAGFQTEVGEFRWGLQPRQCPLMTVEIML